MTYPSAAERAGSDMHIVGVFGGVLAEGDHYKAVIAVTLPNDAGFLISRRAEFKTAAEAERDYRADGNVVFETQIRILKLLAVMHDAKVEQAHIPLCPLIDSAVFLTRALITKGHYDAMFAPDWEERLKELPELEQDEE